MSRYVTASVTISNDLDTLREVWEASDAVYDSLSAKNKIDWLVSFVPQPKMQQSHAASRGGNMLGLENVEEDQIGKLTHHLGPSIVLTPPILVVWLLSRWDDAQYDDVMTDARAQLVDSIVEVAKRRGTLSPFVYVNYAAPEQDPLCGYGSENAAFLREVAEEYDPTGVFQKLMPGGFKISKAGCTQAEDTWGEL
jgi:FAD/FMN-containing dehydrogenase